MGVVLMVFSIEAAVEIILILAPGDAGHVVDPVAAVFPSGDAVGQGGVDAVTDRGGRAEISLSLTRWVDQTFKRCSRMMQPGDLPRVGANYVRMWGSWRIVFPGLQATTPLFEKSSFLTSPAEDPRCPRSWC